MTDRDYIATLQAQILELNTILCTLIQQRHDGSVTLTSRSLAQTRDRLPKLIKEPTTDSHFFDYTVEDCPHDAALILENHDIYPHYMTEG